jgi:archaetidylinositol phosphate synthase
VLKPPNGGVFRRSLKTRPCVELLSQYVYRPLAHLVVIALLPLGVAPTVLVATHTLLGMSCGWLIATGRYGWAAVLIQVKTVLDNADGQLARAGGKATEIGRYADTEGDLVVNVALFAGIGWVSGAWVWSVIALVGLTLLLSCDFNAEWMYRRANDLVDDPPADTSRENQFVLRLLRRVYTAIFLPQDRTIRHLSEARFDAVMAARQLDPVSLDGARRRYHDRLTLWVLANFELTTQLAVLGLCLWAGHPTWYLWFVTVSALTVVPLQLRREYLARTALVGSPP